MLRTMIHYKPGFESRVLSKQGLTLAELLMATTIVTVILIGLGVASLALRKMDSGFTRNTTLNLQLRAIGEDIRHSAVKAVGIRTDPGIFVDSSIYNMCFRVAPGTLNPWHCYSLSAPAASPDSKIYLYSCDRPAPDACTIPPRRYVGRLAKGVFSTTGNYCNAPTFDGSIYTTDHNLKFKLIARRVALDGASPSCAEPLDKGTENNPQEVIEYTVYPEAHSF